MEQGKGERERERGGGTEGGSQLYGMEWVHNRQSKAGYPASLEYTRLRDVLSRTCMSRHHAYRRASLAVRHADLTVARSATDEYRRPRGGVLHEHEVSHGAVVE